MKIAINAASAKMGGAVSYLTSLLQHLPPPNSGNRFFVFVPDATAKLLPDVPGNIRLCALRGKETGGWRRLWWEQVTLRRFLRNENIDALFSTSNFGMLHCPVRQILLVRNAIYFSKMYQETILPRQSRRRRTAFSLGRRLVLMSVRSADVVMTPTQAMLAELGEYVEVLPHKALVNPYGIQTCNGRRANSDRPPAQNGASERSPVRLLYVSLYGEHKNLSTLLRAIPLLNGDGSRPFLLKTTANPRWEVVADAVTLPEDTALAQLPEVAPWVQFVGPLDKAETERLYLEADIFVFPSWLESFGFPMVEAMAHGMPIVAADTAVNREVCGDAALYFRPHDPSDLAEKIRCLCADEALRQKLSENGCTRAATHFRWEDHVARLLAAAAPS
jgi:glycosyltransferase involved in cell wall biosynthesis